MSPVGRPVLVLATALLVLVLGIGGPARAQNPPVTVQVNVGANRHPISPLIYGTSYTSGATMADLNFTINRNGSTPASTYNWLLNADNRGDDYFFLSTPYPSPAQGGEIDAFIQDTRNAGAEPLVTIPILGRVADLVMPGRGDKWSFSVAKYGPQTAVEPNNPDIGNGIVNDGPPALFVQNNDPNDASIAPADHVAFQRGWVQHLVATWGTAANGGLRYYLLDNEPGIWHVAHRDVHPVGAKMDEVFQKMRDHAVMIKQVDPGAQVVGPEEWNWWGYFYSGYDEWIYPQDGTQPDNAANGPVIPYYLSRFNQYQQATGQRLLDVLSVHYYPQANEFEASCAPPEPIPIIRNKSTRALWDPNYVEQGCIGEAVYLIPRLKQWIADHYPGTKIALHEYNWGGDAEMSGATAQADILGILGREGLDMAARWLTPDPSTPTYKAMKLYRNYDGARSTFGDTSVQATVPNPDTLAAFAAQRGADGAVTIMVIAKSLAGTTPVTIQLSSFSPGPTAQVFQLTAANVIQSLPAVAVTGNAIVASLPPQSVTLFVVPGVGGGGPPIIVTGAGEGVPGAEIRGFTATGVPTAPDFFAYPMGYTGGVRVAACDFDGDGIGDLAMVAGPGGGPHVRIVKLDAAGNPVGDMANFFAYGLGFIGGLFVACGDVDNQGGPELVLGVDAGGGPHVRVLKITPFAAGDPPALVEFFAYDPGFRGGIRVAVGDVDGSGLGSIVLGAGPGGGPHVRALKYVGGGPAGLVEVASFMVYDMGLTSGIYVATGDVNGDGRADIVTGVGPGGGPHVRAVTRNPDGSVTELASFFAYDPGARTGMRVATVRLNPGDGVDTILTVPGPGSGPHVKAFKWAGAGVPPAEVASFFAYPPSFLGGAFVAGTR